MPPKDKYTNPELRDEIKEEIHNSDKGGKPGQWSARKVCSFADIQDPLLTCLGPNDGIRVQKARWGIQYYQG